MEKWLKHLRGKCMQCKMGELFLAGLFLKEAWYFNLYELSNKSVDMFAFISSRSRGTHKVQAQRGASIV